MTVSFGSIEISALRIAILVIGLVFMAVVARQVRNRTWSRAQVLLWAAVSTGLVLVAAFPGLVSPALGPVELAETLVLVPEEAPLVPQPTDVVP